MNKTEFEKRIENSVIDLLIDTFKCILRYEYKMQNDEIKQMVSEIDELKTFEQKIKYLNSYKFMKAPIQNQLNRLNYYFGGEY